MTALYLLMAIVWAVLAWISWLDRSEKRARLLQFGIALVIALVMVGVYLSRLV